MFDIYGYLDTEEVFKSPQIIDKCSQNFTFYLSLSVQYTMHAQHTIAVSIATTLVGLRSASRAK